ncbi:uncharacterized protein LOC131805779 [Musca domestica]|uniref:Uncharacterized protein LOC109611789 n=1 Tax=Musca domestica TaxID=7370 RepID=A0ABM3VHW8_MUSDO|nr:uncharacterized protein LOC109611789 [Musca domestica]XP_058981911.1 uncharacterized protein LOC109611790 [Musca domestica]XP_058985378.1 uncharacterized protein LOC131805778 [Musca domestica]XP_058985381.1 uncharacterized protein LOC131805779 [Musca domestica]
MGSPASPIIADVVMEVLLDVSVEKMTTKPRLLSKYVDDIFCIIKKTEIENTLKILNTFDKNIQFTHEVEEDGKLPYLDSIIIRHDNNLKLDWYQKPTASGRLINFFSKHPRRVKINTATNFIHRIFNISDQQFHQNNELKIRNILTKNDFPQKTIDGLIKRVKENTNVKITEGKEISYKSLTYIPGFSERFCRSNAYNKDKYQLALKTNYSVNNMFSRTKTKTKKEDKSNVVYKIACNGDETNICQKVYIGTTKTKLKTRLSGHKSDQKSDKPLEQKTALAAHCTLTGHRPNFKDINIMAQENNYKRRFTLEMLHIINVPPEKRMNFKTDTDHCAHIYRNLVHKHRWKKT